MMRLSISARLILFVLCVAIASGAVHQQEPAGPPPMKIRLTDVARQAGVTVLNISGGPRKDYLLESVGSGAAWLDYDNDGLLDLLVVNGSTVEHLKTGGDSMLTLYRNNGDGTFTDVTTRVGLVKKGWGMGVCVADYDNSGTGDVYVTGYGRNALLRNNGDGTFADVTRQAGVGHTGWSTGCSFGDYDRDGFVDLYVARYVATPLDKIPKASAGSFCQYMAMDTFCGPRGLQAEPDILYHSNRDGTFTDVTEKAGIRDSGGFGFQVVFSDFDDDGWLDIYVANDSTPNFLFWNNHNGTFTEGALEAGAALSEEGHAQSGMGVSVGDYKNDGKFGIFVTNFSQDYNTLYENSGTRNFFDVTRRAGLVAAQLGDMGWGTNFIDTDNDGYLDLFVANGHIYPAVDQSSF
ncbi:MAG TPA: VCBS repeat-containing protein, partial [Candidatus Acidoferrales bacterium]|nr:VCBS repeat-containing protein [Candidatus Acidoferrales bacterium]